LEDQRRDGPDVEAKTDQYDTRRIIDEDDDDDDDDDISVTFGLVLLMNTSHAYKVGEKQQK